MDTWESFFREKSRRRALAVSWWSVIGWSLAALGLLALIMGILDLVGL